jgi:hypothetical protein
MKAASARKEYPKKAQRLRYISLAILMDSQLYKNVANSSAHRKSRDDNAAFALKNNLTDDLITLALDVNDEHHFKACWILELVLEENPDLLSTRLTEFCDSLPNFTHDSALRSIAKICMFCAQRLWKQPGFLSEKQVIQITDACFEWLISDEKVAVKAYAIRTLYETGRRLDWVYAELIPVLQHGFPDHSPAYKAAAKHILAKIVR